jgi:hypothetical protein
MSSDAITPEPAPQRAPAPPAAPRFVTEPYQPDGNAPFLGTLLTFAGLIGAGALVGALTGFVHQWFYLVFLFPVVMGLAVGAAGMGLVKAFKLRNSLLAGLAAVLGGVTTQTAMHYVDYQRFLGQVEEKLPGTRAELAAKGFGLPQFIDFRAREGVTIGRLGHGDKGINLGYYGSYVYWGLEVLLIAGIALVMLRAAAAAPFCAACSGWKERRYLARVDTPAHEQVETLRDGELVGLLQRSWPAKGEGLLLKASVCPRCGADAPVDVALESHTTNEKGEKKVKELAHFTYPGDVLPFLDAPLRRT